MSAPGQIGNPTGKGGGVRGKVDTFSIASRRRFRHFLLTHEFQPCLRPYAVTFTVPGPPLVVDAYRAMWAAWGKESEHCGWSIVWRAEVQKRGAMHWHCLAGLPPDPNWQENTEHNRLCGSPSDPQTVEESRYLCDKGLLIQSWFAQLDKAFPMVHYPRAVQCPLNEDRASDGPLSWWPGSDRHAVDVQGEGSTRGSWFRYMADHASKVKEEQVGENIGRHWGVIGRKGFVRLVGVPAKMTERQYGIYRRTYERMATPRVKDERDPFGRRAGRQCKRGRWGNAVCFVRPETVEKLVAYAMKDQIASVEKLCGHVEREQ